MHGKLFVGSRFGNWRRRLERPYRGLLEYNNDHDHNDHDHNDSGPDDHFYDHNDYISTMRKAASLPTSLRGRYYHYTGTRDDHGMAPCA